MGVAVQGFAMLVVLVAGARMWFGVVLAAAGVVVWGFGHAHFRARHGFVQ